jgi:hypothetical protein
LEFNYLSDNRFILDNDENEKIIEKDLGNSPKSGSLNRK